MGILLTADTTFTAVAGDELTAAGEFVDGQTTVVGTTLTFRHAGLELQVAYLLIIQHGGHITVLVMLSGDQCRTESTHDTGDVGTDGLAVGNFLKAAQNGIVVEGTALYYDIFTKLRSIGDFDHLKQSILDNGVSKSCGDVGYGSAFLLCLLYLGVHEYGTTGTQIDRMLCKQGSLSKILHGIIQGFGKGLNKGATAGGTCFVQLYAVYGLVFNLDALHILTADV